MIPTKEDRDFASLTILSGGLHRSPFPFLPSSLSVLVFSRPPHIALGKGRQIQTSKAVAVCVSVRVRGSRIARGFFDAATAVAGERAVTSLCNVAAACVCLQGPRPRRRRGEGYRDETIENSNIFTERIEISGRGRAETAHLFHPF